MSSNFEINTPNKVRQLRKKAKYDKNSVHKILDAGLVAHVAFNQHDGPVVVPMIYGRKDDTIYLHGARKARIIRLLENTNQAINYRSVTIFGKPNIINDSDKKTLGNENNW